MAGVVFFQTRFPNVEFSLGVRICSFLCLTCYQLIRNRYLQSQLVVGYFRWSFFCIPDINFMDAFNQFYFLPNLYMEGKLSISADIFTI